MPKRKLTRRRFLATTAATSALVAMPHVRGSHAAGSLSVGFWDHWVPGANRAMTEICKAWAEKEKVDLKIDYISTQGNKLLMTIALEAQARSGHDVMDFSAWEPAQHAASGSSPWAARHRHGFEGLHDRALLLLGFAARPIRCEQVKFLRATRQTTTPRQAPLRQLLALSL